MGKKSFEEGYGEMMAFFMPLVQLSAAGINKEMKPDEVVDYFMKVVQEFMRKIETMGMP